MGLGNILRRSAARFPEKTALIFEGRRLTYGELDRRVNRLATGLQQTGVKKGDRVAVLLHNGPEFIETYFACARAGAIFVPINNLLKEVELARIIEYIKPHGFLVDPDFEGVIRALTGGKGPTEIMISLGGEPSRPFIHFYGQTETGPLTTVLKPEDHILEGSEAQVARLASAGRAALDFEVRIVDKYGHDVAVGEVGEIIVRSEAMTIGYWGESVKALVVLKQGMEASEAEIIDLCKERLANYKKPKSVEFRQELPKNPTGKILKRVIRSEYWKGRDRAV
jgi:acyl-CoA synthetase (AMP-forming)/AMP-acid ligase II